MILIAIISAKYLNNYYMRTYTEIIRLERITRSPVLSLYSETLNGLTTIRAFSK